MDLAALAQRMILFDIATGVLFVLLGLAVLAIRPRRGVTVALAAWCIGHGGGDSLANALAQGWLPPDAGWISVGIYPLGAAGAVWLAAHWPARADAPASRAWLLPAALALVTFAWGIPFIAGLAAGGAPLPTVLREIGFGLLRAATFLFLFVLALRYPHEIRAGRRTQARAIAIVSLALVLWYAGRAGNNIARTVEFRYAEIFAVASLVALWLHASARAGPDGSRRARDIALVIPAVALAMLLFSHATDPALAGNLGPLGLLRGIGVVVLAYAILQHQILGIDVKIRWGISRSTVAAAFIAVFFIASEGAQILFGAQSEWVGLIAAGALVFAMAPLQRAAERLAERAVPIAAAAVGADPAASSASPDHRALYRRAVRFAIRDGPISPEQELHLFEIAQEMGLGAGDAMRLRQDVEREARGEVD